MSPALNPGPSVEWRNTQRSRPALLQLLRARREAYRVHRPVGPLGPLAGRNGCRGQPGPPAGHPSAGHDVIRSLELMRTLLQSSINEDIKEVLDKYQERFFQPAVSNIRSNLPPAGVDGVLEEQLRLMIQRVLEDAKQMYAVRAQTSGSPLSPRSYRSKRLRSRTAVTPPPPPQPQPQQPTSSTASPPPTPTPAAALAALMTPVSAVSTGGSPPATLQQMFKRRKEMDAEAEAGRKRARLAAILAKRSGSVAGGPVDFWGPSPRGSPDSSPRLSPDSSASPGRAPRGPSVEGRAGPTGTPAAPAALGHVVNYLSPQWDPDRILDDTLFIMGARANKVLGYETSRGRLYTKHPELFKYPSDQEDREWLARNQLIQPTGGKAFVCVLRDVYELAVGQEYRSNANVNLHELKGFHVPDFMHKKIRAYMSSLRTEPMSKVNGLLEIGVPSEQEQEGVVLYVDNVPLVQVAQLGPSSTSLSPCSTTAAHRNHGTSSAITISPGVVPPPLENAATPQPPALLGSAAATTAVATATTVATSIGAAASTPPASTMNTMNPAGLATSLPEMAVPLTMTANCNVESQPASYRPNSKGQLGQGHSLSSGPVTEGAFVVEPLVLEELELYIKETRSADEGNLDLNLEDVHLDVGGGEHGQLELAWDFIGELHTSIPSPTASAMDGIRADDASADDSIADDSAVNDALALADDTGVECSTADDVLTVDALVGGDGAIIDDLAIEPADSEETKSREVMKPDMRIESGSAQQLELAAPTGPSLAMSHVTLSALLSGTVIESLEIPEGLL